MISCDDLVERGAVEVARGDAEHGASPESAKTGRGPEALPIGRKLGVEVRPRAGRHGRERLGLLGVANEEVGGGR